MGSNPHFALTPLRRGEFLRLCDARGRSIVVFRGLVWITQHGDSRDVFIGSGESFVIDRDGLVLVEAIEDARLLVLAPEPKREFAAPAAQQPVTESGRS